MPAAPRQIGLLTALHKPQAVECTRELAASLQAAGVRVLVDPRLAEAGLPQVTVLSEEQWARESDLVIVLGGDGTLLAASHACAPHGTPLLGVDLGGMGFLAEEQFDRVREALGRLLAGDYGLEERLMLQATVREGERTLASFVGLNDAVVAQTEPIRLVNLQAWVGEELVTTYPADGLILATPTGSTAYNLSAGGPLVDPQVDCFILSPICPHSLDARPLVVPITRPVRLALGENAGRHPHVSLTVDGQRHVPLQEGQEVLLAAAPRRALLVRLGQHSFYGRLRKKLHWGAQRASGGE